MIGFPEDRSVFERLAAIGTVSQMLIEDGRTGAVKGVGQVTHR